MRLTSKKSFTLVEVLIATVIVAIALCGILASYVGCFELLSTTKNVNIAINAIEGLLEDIRNTTFTQIYDTYADLNFTVNNMPANRGVVFIDDTDPEMLKVTISVCWRQKTRTFGEDINLNGVIDGTETASVPGVISSPAQLVALVVNR